MKVCFTGDVFLGGDLLNKDVENLIEVDAFSNADKRVINLEQAISNSDDVVDKCTLYTSSSSAIKQLKSLKIDAVNLAHNHIQDKGLNGVVETIGHLKEAGIGSFGAGRDLTHAKQKVKIDNNLFLLGYCDFDRSYLNQIEVAGEEKPGINPLRYKNIIDDINGLKSNEKAILYFHWGKEHVFLPKRYDIELVKKILENDKVLLIVGMHPHRIQGYVEHRNKRAYMSLGNFVFPNFYIKPRTQITYPEDVNKVKYMTRLYHNVFDITYKKWKWINRISLLLEYDTEKNKVKHILVKQNDNTPQIQKLTGFSRAFMMIIVLCLSLVYKLPSFIYDPIEKIHSYFITKKWILGIYLFKIKQIGLKKTLNKYLRKK